MILCVTFENAHLYGSALASQYRLRHRCFIERQDYNVFSYNHMEYDQYDNPSSVYLVYQDDNGQALGVSRLTPVRHRSMLKDLQPDMVEKKGIFSDPYAWEGTRFCVEKELDPALRDKIVKELVMAYYEFGLEHGVSKIIGMMPTFIWKRVLQQNGCVCEILGPVKLIDGQKIQAVSLDINYENYLAVHRKTGLMKGVIYLNEKTTKQAA